MQEFADGFGKEIDLMIDLLGLIGVKPTMLDSVSSTE